MDPHRSRSTSSYATRGLLQLFQSWCGCSASSSQGSRCATTAGLKASIPLGIVRPRRCAGGVTLVTSTHFGRKRPVIGRKSDGVRTQNAARRHRLKRCSQFEFAFKIKTIGRIGRKIPEHFREEGVSSHRAREQRAERERRWPPSRQRPWHVPRRPPYTPLKPCQLAPCRGRCSPVAPMPSQ